MPLRIRELPELPRRIPKAGVHLEEGAFHKIIVAVDRLQHIPHLLFFAAVGLFDLALSTWLGVMPVLALAVAQLCDWLILVALPRRRISFGPVQPQWLTLVGARTLVALIIAAFSAVVFQSQNVVLHALAQAIGVALVFYGYYFEPSRLHLTRIELVVPTFKRGTTVKLLHVADVHIERHGAREDQLLRIARETAPDAILFTGDFLNLSCTHDPLAQGQARELWRCLSGIAPVFAVTGSPPVDLHSSVAKVLAGLQVNWLRDELSCIALRGNHVHIVGVTCTHDPRKDGETLRRVMKEDQPSPRPSVTPPPHPELVEGWERGRGEGDPFTILLYHAPDLAPQAAALGAIDMQFVGHTHGGQVRLPWFGALVSGSLYHRKLLMGLYQLRSMLLFVSRGVGLEGKAAPRVRFLCPPEVTLLTLRGES